MELRRNATYHIHTARCGHASGADEDYVLAAIEAGWKVLGFSDHVPWPYENGFRNPRVRMTVEEMPEYLASLRALREKYREQIRIYIGFECEYFPAYLAYLRDLLRHGEADYLILGNHYALTDDGGLYYGVARTAADLKSYTENALRGMETGLFRYLAHPDLALMSYPVFDDACREMCETLCRRAKELQLPLEYNLQGIRHTERGKTHGIGYPNRRFWEIASESGCDAIIGMDAHESNAVIDTAHYEDAVRTLSELGLHVLDALPGLE